jgi:polysaccharide export outer membrane protein
MMGPLSKRILLVAALSLASLTSLTGCPRPWEGFDYGKEYDPRKHEYIVGVSDVITISVYKMGDLSAGGTVRPDGVITMPLIGDVQVAGKTPSQIRAEMKEKLSSYVKADTVINVTVTGFNSYRFVVTGNVAHAGSLSQKYYVTISEALAMAGGLNKFAGDLVVIQRMDQNRKVREIPISYKALVSGKHPEMDVCVVTGDSIRVE